MQQSLEVLRDGASRSLLCSSIFSFKVGKGIVAAAEALVSRHTEDLVADNHLDSALAFVESPPMKAMSKTTSLAASSKLHIGVGTACAKVLGAVSNWSRIRCQERWEDVSGVVHSLETVCLHTVATAWTEVFRICADLLAANTTSTDYEALVGWAGPSQSFKVLRNSTVGISAQKTSQT